MGGGRAVLVQVVSVSWPWGSHMLGREKSKCRDKLQCMGCLKQDQDSSRLRGLDSKTKRGT